MSSLLNLFSTRCIHTSRTYSLITLHQVVRPKIHRFNTVTVSVRGLHQKFKSTCHAEIRLLNFVNVGKRNAGLLTSSVRNMSHKNSQKSYKQPDILVYFVAGTFVIGGVLMFLVLSRYFKRYSAKVRGVKKMHDPLLGRRSSIYSYRGYIYPEFIINNTLNLHFFETREDDVWIVSHPKAGTTWMEEIVYLITSDLDFKTAGEKTLEDRIPYFEFEYPGLKHIKNMPSKRIIKSHLPMSFLPNDIKKTKPKIVYIARNPKDTVVSYYHFHKMLKVITYSGTMDDFVDSFKEGKCFYSPWWNHVLEAWKKRDNENVFFVKYEDMQKDIKSVIKEVSRFLGKSLSEKEIDQIAEYTQFDKMKKNPMSNYSWWRETGFKDGETDFLRKGIVGDWKNELKPVHVQTIDQIVNEKLAGSGLVFEDSI